jgi:hypothetical protein
MVVLEKFEAARQPDTSVDNPRPKVRMLLVHKERLTSSISGRDGTLAHLHTYCCLYGTLQ